MSKYLVMPYVLVDGVPTWKDSDLQGVYNKIVFEGLEPIMFTHEENMTGDSFVIMAKSVGTIFFGAFDMNNNLAGVLWLNRFEGKIARMHFCIFKNWWGKSSDIMGIFREYAKGLRDENGNPLFIRFVGYIPSKNKHAIKCALRDGCSLCGVIPGYFWDYKQGEAIDATVVYL